ncbi:MAG: iron ABC transporter permease [Acutalibacteraceae bacterium]
MNKERAGRREAILLVSGVLLLVLAAASICMGAVPVTLRELAEVLTTGETTTSAGRIIWFVRMPRTLAAILAGSALAVSGAVLQTVLNNPLASPSIIGVNAGSGLFTIALAAFFPGAVRYTPAAAFLGALFAVFAVYGIARKTGASRMTIVLSGVAVSSFLSAFTDAILTFVPDTQMNRMAFLIGSFSGVSMDQVRFAAGYILFGVAVSVVLSYDMNVLALGEETAASLGLRTGLYRMVFLVTAALLAGSAVSFSGLIGFVGLIVPHAGRMLVGQDNRYLIPLCVLLGGAFTLGCDIIARVLFAPFELPVGIVMSFLGGPFFIYLLLSRKGRKSLD